MCFAVYIETRPVCIHFASFLNFFFLYMLHAGEILIIALIEEDSSFINDFLIYHADDYDRSINEAIKTIR